MVDLATRGTPTRSRFFRLVEVRDLGDVVVRHAPAIFTEDQWGDWRGVLHKELPVQLGQQVIVRTPAGESRCIVDDKAHGQTLLLGLDPSPF